MDNLSDLAGVLRSLGADKVNDRKKAADRLRQLLSKSSVCQCLTKPSEGVEGRRRAKEQLKWDTVLKAVIAFVQCETEHIQKAKETISASSRNTREAKKREISGLFKCVIRAAEKSGGYMKSSLLLNHLMDIVKGEFTCAAYGTDYSNILLKNILGVRKYWLEITPKTWNELLVQYCHFFLDANCPIDRSVISRLILEMAKGASQQCDLQPKKLLVFFTEVFKNIREHKSMLENIMEALNIFTKAIAPGSRVQICKLGETILSSFIHLWDNYPSEPVKDGMVEFAQLQLKAHHPGGAQTADQGAFAIDWDVWKSHLRKLYEIIISDVDGRPKFSSGTKSMTLKDSFVELAADICHQLYKDDCNVIEVTQLPTTTQREMGGPAKKRRVMSGWTSLIEAISEKSGSIQVIPWLQLLSCVLDKYPSSLAKMDGFSLLLCLQQALATCKGSEMYRHIFSCLTSLARCVKVVDLAEETRERMSPVWLQLWSTCLSLISSRQAETDGYQEHGFKLQTTMLQSKLVVPGRHMWNLFLPDVISPTPASLTFLTTLLCTCRLPENFQPSILGSSFSTEKIVFPLRRHLLKWVMVSLSLPNSCVKQWIKATGGNVAVLLVQLLLREPGLLVDSSEIGAKTGTLSTPKPDLRNVSLKTWQSNATQLIVDHGAFVTQLENVFLLTTFDMELDFERKSLKSGESRLVCDGLHTIPDLVALLINTLQSIVSDHLQYEVQMRTAELLAYDCSILSHCMVLAQRLGIPLAEAETLLKRLLSKLEALLSECVGRDGTAGLLPVLHCLQDAVTFHHSADLACFNTAETFRACFPDKLVDFLLQLINRKLKRSTSNLSKSPGRSDSAVLPRIHSAGSSRHVSRMEEDDPDGFDDSFSKSAISQDADDDVDDMGFDLVDGLTGENERNLEGTQRPGSSFSLLDAQILNDNQRLRNATVMFLSHLTGLDKRQAPGAVATSSSLDVSSLQSHLTNLINEGTFDASEPADIQMMQQIIETLLSNGNHITDSEIEKFIDVLRRVARANRQDQEVCSLVLSLLGMMAPFLCDPDHLPSQTLLESRENLLQLISVFWRLQSDGSYNSQVRLSLAKCMAAISQHDPEGLWGTLKLAAADESSADGKSMPSVVEKFPFCLIDGSLEVRLFMASTLKRLFMTEIGGKQVPRPRQQQHEAFDMVYEICNDLMEIQGRLSPERQQDERWNRMASLLLVLSSTAVASPVCEKKAIFALCQVIQEKNVEVALVSKITEKMSVALGYKTAGAYLSSHLPFLISHWLDLGYNLSSFPFSLLQCTDIRQFYSTYTKILVPHLFERKQDRTLADVGQVLEKDLADILRSCFPAILVHILPVFAASKQRGSQYQLPGLQRRLADANHCYDSLVAQFGQEAIDKIIVNQLGDIVVNILSTLVLERESHSQDGSCEPEPNPPAFSEELIRTTLDYLTQSFSGSSRSLVAVLAKLPDGIEQVLLSLCLLLWGEIRAHERLRRLRMLQLMSSMLLEEMAATDLGGAWAFVIRRLTSTLLQLLSPQESFNGAQSKPLEEDYGYQEDIVLVSLSMLRQVCSAVKEFCHEELEKYMGSIVDVVSQLALRGGEIGQTATLLLKYLLLESTDITHKAVENLDPLPSHEIFAEVTKHCRKIQKKAGRDNFVKLVEQVVKAPSQGSHNMHSFSRTLHLLSEEISVNKERLHQMLGDSQGSGVICQLVCELLCLTRSPVAVVAMEAGRCLGSIGPINLKAASMPHPLLSDGLAQALKVFKGEPSEKYCYIFHMLNQYLVDPSVEVVAMASTVLKKLLATPAGVNFSADYKEKLANKDFLFQYLHPFRASKQSKGSSASSASGCNVESFSSPINCATLWLGKDGNHESWIQDLCVSLLKSGAYDSPVLLLLQPVCLIKVQFCEMLLPYLVHEILLFGQPENRTVLSEMISRFFSVHRQLTMSTSHSSSKDTFAIDSEHKSVCTNKESVLVMLKIVNYLRTRTRPAKGKQVMTAWDNNFWLDLNYLDIAWAAHHCSAHFSAVVMAEIWWDARRQMQSVPSDGHSDQSEQGDPAAVVSQSSSVFSDTSEDIVSMQALMLEALRSIGDPDAVYGCGAGSLPDASCRVKTYLHEKHWEKAMVTLDIQMQEPTTVAQLQLFKTVQMCGGDYLLGACLRGLEEMNQTELTEFKYQAAWKAGTWDLDIPTLSDVGVPIHQSLYACLHAVRDNQPGMALQVLSSSRCRLLGSFDVNLESCRSILPLISDLQCLQQFELFLTALTSPNKKEAMESLLSSWQHEEIASVNADFEFMEPAFSLRMAALRLLASTEGFGPAKSVLQEVLLHTAKAARVAGHYQMAERFLHELQLQSDLTSSIGLNTQLQLAELFWARNEQTTAKHVLKLLIKRCKQLSENDGEAMRLLIKSLSLYGNWLAVTRSETPTVIMEQYLEKTVQLLEGGRCQGCEGEVAMEAYLSLARFADGQYQNIVNYMNSPTFEAKQALMNKATADLEKYSKILQPSKERYLRILEKQSKIDQQEVASLAEDRKRFLHHAVRCYAQCLKLGDAHDLRIFRLMALWFDNSASPEVGDVMKLCAEGLKSYKFLPLMHQLAARMSTKVKDNRLFLQTLNTILERASVDHPYHTLWVLLALAHANKDEELANQGQSSKRRGKLSTGKVTSRETEDKVEAAKELVQKLKSDRKVSRIVQDMEMLATAYVELANYPAEQFRKETNPIPLPKSLRITSVKDLTQVAVPSLELTVDPSCTYERIVTVVGYKPNFRLAGGVNLPKIITCQCSDGVDRRQLVKGRDDLRQDAVLQQVFSLVNKLLISDPITNSRQLNVRTYKVVPLSRRSGLLEWCEGTRPIGDYLVGSGVKPYGAHGRYRPKDWNYLDCRKHMMSVASSSDTDQKYKAYMEVCQNFQPVFRFFFMEYFPEPAEWFQCRLAYTRSVATNSIVGYILGLGDRHVMNILIDCRSAELIHIDLGIAFEQGHILPTPETVPFRLTRDIVDGMGVMGVEGVYRRCCEKTMEVMRANQESLLTIVQVLLHDPLSDWNLSPQKVYELQGRSDRRDIDTTELNVSLVASSGDADMDDDDDKTGSADSLNKLAERVLLRLSHKLQGLEDGVALSVPGQVNHLIQTARDPHNLSKIFAGWQPYI